MSNLLENVAVNKNLDRTEINLDNIHLEGELDSGVNKINKSTSSNNNNINNLNKTTSNQSINGGNNMTQSNSSLPSFATGMFTSMSNLNLDAFKPNEWIGKRRETLKPWGEFMNFSKFKKPSSPGQFGLRLVKNLNHFQSNYLFVFVFLAIYCILTSPMLLLALMAFAGGCYILYLKNKDGQLKVMGKEFSLGQMYAGAGLCSIPLFLLVGAGSAVFWIIGASIVVIILHAVFYAREEHDDPFMLQMNIV